MRLASILWFLFSVGGIVSALLIAAVWVLIRPKSRLARWYLVAIAIGYWLASTSALPNAVAARISGDFRPLTRSDVPQGRSVVVLLGSGNRVRADWDHRIMSIPDSIGAERTLEAARVFSLVQSDLIISSGGVIDPEEDDVAAGQTMKEWLVGLRVPADRIIVEGKSTNTRDEAVIVAEMLPSLHVDHVILVTSQIHMRRALGMFRAVGITAIPAVAREPTYSAWTLFVVPNDTSLRLSALAVHEMAGLVYYRLKGWYR